MKQKSIWNKDWVLAKPTRTVRRAMRYWRPKRLTLKENPPVYAWLWWNF
jgi:hypothetical protein